MLNRTTRPYLLIIFALLSLVLVSVYPLALRGKAETRNQAVSLAAEFDAIESLAAGSGVPIETAAADLKEKGLNAVTINEESIGELITSGQLTVKTISVRDTASQTQIQVPALVLTDLTVLPRIQRGMTARFGSQAGRLELRDHVVALPALPISLIRSVSVGLPPEQVKIAKENHFQIIARAGNPPAATVAYVNSTLADLKESGAQYFLPLGDQVLGHKTALPEMTQTLKSLGLTYVTAEFGKTNGDPVVQAADPTNVVRLHTAQLAEIDKMSKDEAVDRFEKAARERDIRILLLRPVAGTAVSPLTEFGDFVEEVAVKVRADGNVIGMAHGYEDLAPGGSYRILQAAAAALLFWAMAEFFASIVTLRWPRYAWIAPLSGLVVAFGATNRGSEVVTLLVTVLAPIAGFVLAEAALAGLAAKKVASLPAAGVGVGIASLASFAGGIYTAGTMVGVQYLIKLDEFSGIKIAVFLPIVLVGVYFLYRLTDFKATLASALTWGSVLLGVLLIAALAILISRTGNDGIGASGAEMGFRGWLDKVLYVRPRTKEFMIGHPALWVAFGMMVRYRNDRRFYGWIALLLSVGAVGQTGIVNTLCHGHIPYMLSIARIWLGLGLGSLLGAVLWVAVRAILPRPASASGPAPVQSAEQTG